MILRHLCRLVGGSAFFLLAGFSLPAATLPPGFTEVQVASTLSNPTAMGFSPDGRLFVCQQAGQLRVISNGTLLPTPFVTVTTDSTFERGLLGVTFDPNFASNRFVYVYYTVPGSPPHNRVSRFTASIANPDIAEAGSEFVVVDLDNLSATNHNGGAIHFGSDGKLYIGVGDNFVASNAQSLSNRHGKLLRINADGSIPLDNPTTFPGIPGSPTGDNLAIWAVGLRNPYTFAFQPGTGRVFINDVGEETWEEINDGIIASNYGWPNCEGDCVPPNANFRDPLFQYAQSGDPATTGCAIVGGAFYNPPVIQFPSSYINEYFFADLCNGWIRLLDPINNDVSSFAAGISAPVDLKIGPEGSLYYLMRVSGEVWKVSFTGTITPTPTPTAPPTTPTPTATPPTTPTPTVTPPTTPTPTATPPTTPTPTATPPATPTPTATPPTTPTPTVTPPTTPTPTATASPTVPPPPTPTATPPPATQALNLSTRLRVETGDNVGIGGFIITGSSPKQVLLRGIGPSLIASGITDALANPTLDLRDSSGLRILANNNWREDPAQEALIGATGIPPTDDLEAAIVQTLAPGSYTVIFRGMGMTTGIGLVEIYDLSPAVDSKLANLSTRALVDTGDNIVIAGFILGGSSSNDDRIVLRGIGPSLTGAGVPNALADPTLELRDSNGALLIANNDWQDDSAMAAELITAGLAPTNILESGIAATLPPGLYTALLAGVNNGTGVGLVEVYDRGAP